MAIRLSMTKIFFSGAAALLLTLSPLEAQQPDPRLKTDSDHDGLSDSLEQKLLEQFLPRFMIGEHDCSSTPAEFKTGITTPEVQLDNGTIYGQVFPARDQTDHALVAEIHYYHLWRRDCGGHGHPLDTEHVAVLVRASDTHLGSATWQAVYWYAAAHENTVCDVSQIARASTLNAVDHGATIWVSPGKHASYLNGTLCERGCGADRCETMVPLAVRKVINLGETSFPMNGSTFIASKAWPLEAKMLATDFPSGPVQRLNQIPPTDIAWFNPGRHPVQGIIRDSSGTEQVIAGGGRNTTSAISLAGASTQSALSTAGESTGAAVSTAGDSTGNALRKSYSDTRHALGTSARHMGKALHVKPKADDPQGH